MSPRSLAAGLALTLAFVAAPAPPASAADLPAGPSTRANARVGLNQTPGVWERSGDRDWFRVRLVRGRGYVIRTDRISAEPDPAWDIETVLRDPRGRALARTRTRTGSLELPIIAFVAPRTGAYFVDVGGTAAGPTRASLEYGVLVSPDCAASTRTTCLLQPGGAPVGHIQTENDVDWHRAALRAGRSHTIEVAGGGVAFTLALVDARGRRVATGQSPAPGSAVIANFVPPATGAYYAVVSASDPLGLLFAGYTITLRSP